MHSKGMKNEDDGLCTCNHCLYWHHDYPNLSDRLRGALCEFISPGEFDLEISLRSQLAANYIMMGVDVKDALAMEKELNS